MAKAEITFKLIPEKQGANLTKIKEAALKIAKENGAIGEMQAQQEPIAFGLIAVLILAMYTVESSDFDAIANKMSEIPQVQSAEIAKMDLPLG